MHKLAAHFFYVFLYSLTKLWSTIRFLISYDCTDPCPPGNILKNREAVDRQSGEPWREKARPPDSRWDYTNLFCFSFLAPFIFAKFFHNQIFYIFYLDFPFIVINIIQIEFFIFPLIDIIIGLFKINGKTFQNI